MKIIEKKAYGKVNLFLSVGAVREDGRHEVETVMQRVGIYDTVTVEEAPQSGSISLVCDDANLPVNEENIAYLAAKKYLDSTKRTQGIQISIEKRIPVKAGMGGGSSDAAAVLIALNELYSDLNFNELAKIASSIGADVPFFLYDTDTMLGKGTGTELYALDVKRLDAYGVFVTYGEKLSTGKMYGELDSVRGNNGTATVSSQSLISAMRDGSLDKTCKEIKNDFEQCCPTFNEVSEALTKLGCKKAFLCGSGPTVCGVFESEEKAVKAKKLLDYPAFVCKMSN